MLPFSASAGAIFRKKKTVIMVTATFIIFRMLKVHRPVVVPQPGKGDGGEGINCHYPGKHPDIFRMLPVTKEP